MPYQLLEQQLKKIDSLVYLLFFVMICHSVKTSLSVPYIAMWV